AASRGPCVTRRLLPRTARSLTDERPLMGLQSRARVALLRRGGLQSVHVRGACEGADDGRALARCMGRARRVRDVVRDPANCPEHRELDASPDSTRRRCARAGKPGPRRIVCAVFAYKLTATNPLAWVVVMGLVAVFVAYGRYALMPPA